MKSLIVLTKLFLPCLAIGKNVRICKTNGGCGIEWLLFRHMMCANYINLKVMKKYLIQYTSDWYKYIIVQEKSAWKITDPWTGNLLEPVLNYCFSMAAFLQ